MSLLLLLNPATETDQALGLDTAEAIARRQGFAPAAPHAIREVVLYYRETPESEYLVLLQDPDTGIVDIVIDSDRAWAFRRLAQSFEEDA